MLETVWNAVAAILAFPPVAVALFMVALMVTVAIYTLMERKVIGFMQVRMGPNWISFFGLPFLRGVAQPFADVIKLLVKEVILPTNANRYLFMIAPLLAIVPALSAWAVVPFAENWVFANVNAGLLYVLALTSMGVYGIIVAGWASNSKYAFLGAMRSAAQVVSYEIAMGFALIGVMILAGSLNLQEIVLAQQGNIFDWYWFPLLPLFVVYLISGVAETNRAPFDVAEGESEIVAGFHVEYSGAAFAVFFLAEYANMILIAALTTVMFVGGWLSPFAGLPGVGDSLLGKPHIGWFLVKMVFFMFLFLWFRATFPRYRYDQIMRLGWKVFIPITIVWVMVTAVMMLGGLVQRGV